MDLVRHDNRQLLEPVRPVSEKGVRSFGGCHDYVELFKGRINGVVVPDADSDLHPERFELLQVFVLLRGESTERNDVQRLPSAKYRGEDRQVGHERLSTRGRDREDEVLAEEGGTDGVRLRRIELLDALPLQDFHDSRVQPEVGNTHPFSDEYVGDK